MAREERRTGGNRRRGRTFDAIMGVGEKRKEGISKRSGKQLDETGSQSRKQSIRLVNMLTQEAGKEEGLGCRIRDAERVAGRHASRPTRGSPAGK